MTLISGAPIVGLDSQGTRSAAPMISSCMPSSSKPLPDSQTFMPTNTAITLPNHEMEATPPSGALAFVPINVTITVRRLETGATPGDDSQACASTTVFPTEPSPQTKATLQNNSHACETTNGTTKYQRSRRKLQCQMIHPHAYLTL